MIAATTGLPRVLDEIEHLLPVTAGPFGFDCARLRQVADIGAGDEGFIARARQDDAAHGRIILRILEGAPQVLPGRRIQGVQHLGPVDRHIGKGAPLLIEDIRKRQCWRRRDG